MDPKTDAWKDFQKGYLLTAILAVVFGVVLVVWPTIVGNVLCYAFGGALCMYGLLRVIAYFRSNAADSAQGYDLALGLIVIILGVLVIVLHEYVLGAIPAVLAVIIIIKGLFNLQHAIDMARAHYKKWVVSLIVSLVTVVLGIVAFCLVLSHPDGALMWLIGVALIVEGLADIVTLITLAGSMKQQKTKLNQ